ncbi:Protein deglycase DJ-1zDJ-1 [Allomyces javanicus]|nr:Protein deglycase DJ-1zDJ-1 [Allomyces javanicus]
MAGHHAHAHPTALVVVAHGSEEMEAVIAIDVLRRAHIDVTVAGLTGSEPIKCSRGVVIVPDTALDACKNKHYDVVVLPGGMDGARAFEKSKDVHALIAAHLTATDKCRHVAIICASPVALVPALASLSLPADLRITSHPCVQSEIEAGLPKAKYVEDRVVSSWDGRLITSRGPGTAYEFSLAIVETLVGKEVHDKVAAPMLLPQL